MFSFRPNMDNPEHRQAWEILQIHPTVNCDAAWQSSDNHFVIYPDTDRLRQDVQAVYVYSDCAHPGCCLCR